MILLVGDFMLLAIDEIKEAIQIYLDKGYEPGEISVAFGAMYCDNEIDYDDLKNAISLLGFQMYDDFDALEEEKRKDFLRMKYNLKKKEVM